MNRCYYCGQTNEFLSALTPTLEPIVLCSCCNHCYVCRVLVKAHKKTTKTEKPNTFDDSVYTQDYLDSWYPNIIE